MIVCDCCKEPIKNSSRLTLSWVEDSPPDNQSGYGAVFNKSHEYDLCDKCRESLLTCMNKGPIWQHVTRMEREFTEIKGENNSLKAVLDNVAEKYKELKEENAKLKGGQDEKTRV